MKRIILIVLALCGAATARAQTFTPAAGFTSVELFNLGSGFTISAFAASAQGDLFYLATGVFDGKSDTQLFQRTAASSYTSETSLFSYGSPVFGSFVKVSDSTVYFGESNAGSIRSIGADGSSPLNLGSVAGNYDMAFFGGETFVSADTTFTNNRIFRLVLDAGGAISQLDTILDTGGDYSGPIAFDSFGNLLYGSAGDTVFGDAPLPEELEGNIFSFTPAEIAAATDADPSAGDAALTLNSDGMQLFNSDNNQYLAILGLSGLYQADSTESLETPARPTQVQLFDLASPGSSPLLVGETGAGEFFSGLSMGGGAGFIAVSSSFGSGPSAVFQIVPEPAPGLCLIIGGALAALPRNRRQLVA